MELSLIESFTPFNILEVRVRIMVNGRVGLEKNEAITPGKEVGGRGVGL